ncbi:auxin-induced protein 22E-like [Vicia villosa]|uniref:auxin-induced protein 22E-like n=1 Tax=Vicia villosa TaxID=3911 RepID=UPI00273AB921|nr:auxin-induced protein 22E-like [Vicia villosa]
MEDDVARHPQDYQHQTQEHQKPLSTPSSFSHSTTPPPCTHLISIFPFNIFHNNLRSSKVQVVGWPPIRLFRKKSLKQKKVEDGSGMYVKVSMAGAPYLRKIDFNVYKSYSELLIALENLFKCTIGEYSERERYNGSEHAPTYEYKDDDWMLVGDVPCKLQ